MKQNLYGNGRGISFLAVNVPEIVIERICTRNDVRLNPYRRMKERTLRGDNLFIAEGDLVVTRLIESTYRTQSVLLTERLLDRLSPVLDTLPKTTPVYLLDENELKELVGFEYYQGVLAVGERKEYLSLSTFSGESGHSCWVVLPDTTKPDNLGLIFRSGSAFEIGGVIMGERCCDPFSRRTLRVSMGGILRVPIYRSNDLAAELLRIQDEGGIELFATVLAPDAVPLSRIASWPKRTGFVFGNEFGGLAEPWISRCLHRITIPMSAEVDSLNLGVAVGIFLYEFYTQVG